MTEKQVLLHKGGVNIPATESGEKWATVKIIPALFAVLLLVSGCGEPNLNDPKVRDKILAEALPENNLQTRRTPSGEEMHYAPNEQTPYTGWLKENKPPMKEGKYRLWKMRDGKKHGKWAEWYRDGQTEIEGSYQEDKKHGKWTRWRSNGQKVKEENYQDGVLHGKWVEWYENGQIETEGSYQIETEGSYQEDKKHGKWTRWRSNGQKVKEENYQDGVLHGKWTKWYENGQIEAEGSYQEGKGHGKLTKWYENGQPKVATKKGRDMAN